MNNSTFANAVLDQEKRTENGMKARKGTANSNVDLFFKIGSSRNRDIIPEFVAAFAEDKDLALRILQWARDIRGGAGERQTFRNILLYLEANNFFFCKKIMHKIPEIGRWDDLLIFPKGSNAEKYAFSLIESALKEGNGLCAKWIPRKGYHFDALQKHLRLSPKQMRKLLVSLTNVVETKMCKNEWNNINYEHVPSVASSRYRNAFSRHDPNGFSSFVQSVSAGEKKVNANAVFPHDVIKQIVPNYYCLGSTINLSEVEKTHIVNQWNALPNPFGEKGSSILPMVDVSGSMACPAGKNANLTCLHVALALGLFCSDKNNGKFKDLFLTFSRNPQLLQLKGTIFEKLVQMNTSQWQMNTDLHKAFDKILDVALQNKVPEEEMPKMLLILSDMQFDECAVCDHSALEMIRMKYEEAGYKVPAIVFWNLNSKDNVPAKFDEKGIGLVSGFSPSILNAVLSGNFENLSPEGIMFSAVMKDRYSLSL